jgi:ABC-type lipoprotein release transport system permease subunit
MSLINFQYLRRQRILGLIVILTLTSTLFSITAYSFLGFYNGFTNYVGEEQDVIAVYSTKGSTPFTGAVSLALNDRINTIEGVIATSPETIAPSTINGQSVFIRGILPQELSKLNSLTILQGENLNLTDTNAAIIGKNLSQRLNLKVGDEILAFSVLSERYVQLVVRGVYQSESSLNDEVLVPLYVGQWLRGVNYNDVTFIRAKIDPAKINANQIYQEIANKTAPPTASPSPTPKSTTQRELESLLPLVQTNLNVGNIGIDESQQFMKNYLDRYGISKDTLIILAIIVLIFASGTAICALTLFIKQHATDIETIRAIGVSTKKIKIDLLLRMLIWSLMATIIGTLVSAAVLVGFERTGYLQVLSHTISFQLDPLIVALNFIFLSLLTSINIARRKFKQ